MDPSTLDSVLQQISANLIVLSAEVSSLKLALALRRYVREQKHNPDWPSQPRAPAGTPLGGRWVVGGGGGAPPPRQAPDGARPIPTQGGPGPRPPPRPPGPGHNRPPRIEPAPERLDWRAVSDHDYFENLGRVTQMRRSSEREAALKDAIRSIDPDYVFRPIATPAGSRTTYEEHLREQLHVLRIQAYGPLGMEAAQWDQFRTQVTDALRDYPGAQAYLRGSAVSGRSQVRGVLTETGPNDFDMAIVSPLLFAAARQRRMPMHSRDRTAPLQARQMTALGVVGLSRDVNGREVTYMIFSSAGAMRNRPGPAVPLMRRDQRGV